MVIILRLFNLDANRLSRAANWRRFRFRIELGPDIGKWEWGCGEGPGMPVMVGSLGLVSIQWPENGRTAPQEREGSRGVLFGDGELLGCLAHRRGLILSG